MKSLDNGFYQSKIWKQTRTAFVNYRISVDGGMCERCKEEPGKIVHHIEHLNKDNVNNPEIALDYSNLRYLCQGCHNEIHNATRDCEKIMFDKNGQPILWRSGK